MNFLEIWHKCLNTFWDHSTCIKFEGPLFCALSVLVTTTLSKYVQNSAGFSAACCENGCLGNTVRVHQYKNSVCMHTRSCTLRHTFLFFSTTLGGRAECLAFVVFVTSYGRYKCCPEEAEVLLSDGSSRHTQPNSSLFFLTSLN